MEIYIVKPAEIVISNVQRASRQHQRQQKGEKGQDEVEKKFGVSSHFFRELWERWQGNKTPLGSRPDSRSKQEGQKMAACCGELSTCGNAPPRNSSDHFVKFSFSFYGN